MSNEAMTNVVELKGIPVFRAGVYPQGVFDREFIETLADNYDPQFHESPNYLMHSDEVKDGAAPLAFGWINHLYVKGDTLYADFANVPRAFAELILAGRVKKRSVEIYPDLSGKGPYLRAIAWPLVPEVKALADVHPTQVFHDDGEFHTIDFEEKESDMSDQNPFLTRDELQETIRQLKEDLNAEQRKMLAELEVKMFCEQMVACGKMTPAERQTEELLLIEQRRREHEADVADDAGRLSDRRMAYFRSRPKVLELGGDGRSDAPAAAGDPGQQKLLRYFHDHQEFFSRLGVTFDDLAAAERYEKSSTNPLTD